MVNLFCGNEPQIVMIKIFPFQKTGEDELFKTVQYILNALAAGKGISPQLVHETVGTVRFHKGIDTLL
jgi:hypothetical protein